MFAQGTKVEGGSGSQSRTGSDVETAARDGAIKSIIGNKLDRRRPQKCVAASA
jgi:hypothetical protein